MQRTEKDIATLASTSPTRAGTDVEQRRRVIVALLQQHPDGLTPREIREATGFSKTLTESALSGLFTRSIVHKRGHRYVLTA
jgi:predicted transcriptional regulator